MNEIKKITEKEKSALDRLIEAAKKLDEDNIKILTAYAQGMAIGKNLNKAG